MVCYRCASGDVVAKGFAGEISQHQRFHLARAGDNSAGETRFEKLQYYPAGQALQAWGALLGSGAGVYRMHWCDD